ncbi:hypothetical protein V7S43_009898 [Phytophthora oleae]|uniref:Crinkler effector protein N-terminal domain-containing protein n=1 Tax=Phytophthora oleae TaxID=2107226 RepID=A0ABD3FHC8_9STRA
MLELLCEAGSAFSVRINENKSVASLKDAIKNKNSDIACPARDLQLFLMKKGDNWLPDDDIVGAEQVEPLWAKRFTRRGRDPRACGGSGAGPTVAKEDRRNGGSGAGRYLRKISPSTTACAVLFDRRSFWLINSYKSVVVKVEKSTWVRKGSKESFQTFITQKISPWVARLTNACSLLSVDVNGDAFLGRGAFGCVFKVTRRGEKVLALKIVEQDSVGRLYREKQALTNAQDTGLTISPVEEVFEIDMGAYIGAALLLFPVGAPLPHPTTLEEVQRLFELL